VIVKNLRSVIVFIATLVVSPTAYVAAQTTSTRAAARDMSGITLQTPRADLERRIVGKHPVVYLVYADQLWGAGRSDESVFWYFVGELRYRFYLASNPAIDPTGDPDLFAVFQATLGEPIDLYAGADPDRWAREMDDVLRWDAAHVNGFTSKTTHAKELADVRAGLVKLRDTILKNKPAIEAQREQSGIGTIGVVNGVYVEEKNEKMPKDWPSLTPQLTLEALSGAYAVGITPLGPIFFLGPILFFDDQTRHAGMLTSVEITIAGPNSLLIIGKRKDAEVLRKTVTVRTTSDAATFDYSRPAIHAGLSDGSEKNTISLRKNTAGELVVEHSSTTEGHYPNKATPVRLTYTFWYRAPRIH
jgi:hypothetical protein